MGKLLWAKGVRRVDYEPTHELEVSLLLPVYPMEDITPEVACTLNNIVDMSNGLSIGWGMTYLYLVPCNRRVRRWKRISIRTYSCYQWIQRNLNNRQTRERQLVHGRPVPLLRTQTEAVAYKPTLARPSARTSRCGIGGGRCGGCVRHRQELSTSS